MPRYGTSERSPTLSETLDRARTAAAEGLYVALPGVVHKYDATTRKADVSILIRNAFLDEDDARQTESMGIVPACPVQFPWGFTAPISDGNLLWNNKVWPATTGGLVFCDRSIGAWLSGDGREVDPEIDHEHHISDAWFQPGLFTFSKAPAAPQDAIVIGSDGTGTDFAALAAKVDKGLHTLYSLLNGVFGATSTPLVTSAPAAPDTVYVAMKTAIASLIFIDPTQWPPASVAAKEVKVK